MVKYIFYEKLYYALCIIFMQFLNDKICEMYLDCNAVTYSYSIFSDMQTKIYSRTLVNGSLFYKKLFA